MMTHLAALALAIHAQTLGGVVDIHAHSGPDSMPRSIDALDLAKLARKRGLRAIVLKNHYEPTAALAELARRAAPGLEVFGGIALNLTVGGLNAAAVERMTRVEGGRGRVVWLPTFDAENHVRIAKESRPFAAVSIRGALLPETLAILDLIAKHKLVLATGHSSPGEVEMIVREAKKRGIAGMVVTHALLRSVGMSVEQAKKAAEAGAYIEFVSNALLGHTKEAEPRDYARAMLAIGPEHCILSSDLGQARNPSHPDGLQSVFALLRREGLTEEQIARMV
ncbi:MAG: DUF6282 family protein, partial [Bryobacteraceae bacterium]